MPKPSSRLRLLKDAEFALENSGSMALLYTLFIASHLLNSPPHVRVFFAVALLFFLSPKVVCGFYRMRRQCNP